jgi:flavin-dependent dehydrogenase
MAPVPTSAFDVIVIGGGLAGKAASIHLARSGLSVVCIESQEERPAVGESLDWSAPDLLKVLGLPMVQLVNEGIATWKKHVTLQLLDGRSEQYSPSPWLSRAPFHVELRTLHVDRVRLDNQLLNLAIAQGVQVIRDKVVAVERQGNKILSVKTGAGSTFAAHWFIDSSGFTAPVLAREFNLPAIEFGPPKVALWTYFTVKQSVEGTTLYMDPYPSKYLDWVWEIPINPDTVSVGYVTTGAAIKVKREQGLSVDEIFHEQLKKHPHFVPMLTAVAISPLNVTSFRCRVHERVAGPNWMIAGEAASMVDPITANGVTARAKACGGSGIADPEISQARRSAGPVQSFVQQPNPAIREILQQRNRENRLRAQREKPHWATTGWNALHKSGVDDESAL